MPYTFFCHKYSGTKAYTVYSTADALKNTSTYKSVLSTYTLDTNLNYHFFLKHLKEKHNVCIKEQGNDFKKTFLFRMKHLLPAIKYPTE
jgi:hypothetical protein